LLALDFATPADMALCRQMIRQGSKSFHMASLLLPSTYREHARALYGFCRMADDLVDHATTPRQAVAELSARLDHIYAGIPDDNPTDRAFADVVLRFAIPRQVPDALIEGFAWDAEGHKYETLSDVIAYGVRVAGTVGVMMSLLMGERRPEALARAIDLGVAMQFSNIARDVEEDAKMGRVYLPGEWLKTSGTQALAASRLVGEAERIYDRAAGGIAMLPRSCRASINAARLLYREIGRTAQLQQHHGRAVVSFGSKLALVARAIVETPLLPRIDPTRCLREGQFLLDAVASGPKPSPARKGLGERLGFVMQIFMAVEGRKS
jgi:15-cis-phytoene synthase